MIGNCKFCDREKELTFHHYIPKTLHTNKLFKKKYNIAFLNKHGVFLCSDCHKNIHAFFTEKELGKYYNNKQKLLSNIKVRNFLKWIKKQNN